MCLPYEREYGVPPGQRSYFIKNATLKVLSGLCSSRKAGSDMLWWSCPHGYMLLLQSQPKGCHSTEAIRSLRYLQMASTFVFVGD